MRKVCCSVVLVVGVMCVPSLQADMTTQSLSFGNTGDSFSTNMTLSGAQRTYGSGTYYQWVGWPVSNWASVNITWESGYQDLSFEDPCTYYPDPDTLTVTADPTGNGQVSFERLFTTFDDGRLDTLDADLLGTQTQEFSTSWIWAETNVGWLSLLVWADGELTELGFEADDEQMLTVGPNGQYHLPPEGEATYAAGGLGTVTLSHDTTLCIGINIGGFDWDPDYTIDLSGTQSQEAGLGGAMTLYEIGEDGQYPKDAGFDLGIDLDGSIDLPFSTSGSIHREEWLSSEQYYVININYEVDGSIRFDDVSFELHDTLEGVIPEPTTAAVFGLVGAMAALARRQRR